MSWHYGFWVGAMDSDDLLTLEAALPCILAEKELRENSWRRFTPEQLYEKHKLAFGDEDDARDAELKRREMTIEDAKAAKGL